ncbi:MAG: hypothetical protein KJ609_20980 [Gammaproteobacteria bacterium]|uniref:Outer membrane protein beta-barrel domain-containing protein n=1 Tax=Marinomonas polaris DSM 16579 TaxID=1122206 RepID=A0A1M4UM25_9GAMM|nr:MULTISPECIES: hypothetical protein [Marinomonas]MBU1295982.1 hypothetical protein [Gammaproteobacteria bacterium]MBU1468983.1 hypothetical protein [Gammaproteobacteria bacterium]MBU2023638.1 hypothetical protein [Gammaproteobacteria bacterium]MBU2238643.1 hypothetical protein [Gammaproteobacteria bacterium]MBU2321023.1 hypothetical protein [Gammaproteobacteria bacterium]
MTVLARIFVSCLFVSGAAHAEREPPNFAFGLGYGLLDEKSLMNIDFKVNIPINDYLSTQVLLNSNYLITGSSKSSFAQSELSSNWFLHNEYGRLGVGVGISELEPMDEELESERDVIGQFIGEAFLGSFSLTTNYISTDTTLSNVTSSRIGIGYYFNEDLRTSLYREKYNLDEVGWRLETYFQPKKYRQMGSVGVIARTGDDYDYLGVVVQYYFDYAVSLKQRDREFH